MGQSGFLDNLNAPENWDSQPTVLRTSRLGGTAG